MPRRQQLKVTKLGFSSLASFLSDRLANILGSPGSVQKLEVKKYKCFFVLVGEGGPARG